MENWETEPYGDILQEAVRQTAPGETYEVSIEIKDYYVNYPLVFWLEGHSTMYVDMYDEACGYSHGRGSAGADCGEGAEGRNVFF